MDSLKRSHVDQCNDGRVSGKTGEVSVSSDQSQTAKPVANQLCQLESDTKPIVALQNVPASDLLQNALVLLYNKRQQLVIVNFDLFLDFFTGFSFLLCFVLVSLSVNVNFPSP